MENENLIVKMLEAGLHFGHQKSKRHPKMEPYIFTVRNGISIIDLQKTQEKLGEVLHFVQEIVSRGGQILFLGSKKQAQEIIRETALKTRMPYVVKRWLGGTFTNFDVIHQKVERLKKLEEGEKGGEWEKYTKKERLALAREKEKLTEMVGGLATLKGFPQAIFIIDVVKEKNAVLEARRKKVPIIALVDTNGNPELIDYPIPGNDDAIRGIEVICAKVGEAITEVQKNLKTIKPS